VTNPEVWRELDFSLWGGPREKLNQPAVFAAGFVTGSHGLSRVFAGAGPYYDDPPTLEYQAAKRPLFWGKTSSR